LIGNNPILIFTRVSFGCCQFCMMIPELTLNTFGVLKCNLGRRSILNTIVKSAGTKALKIKRH
jgi:hypothetical protein